tara:strand:- start:731 stop:1624 length:894 start_codon:yes stop_codon:yes gene_type:complete
MAESGATHMFKRILVPLDGGERAAGVLEIVEPFRSSGSELELFLALEAGAAADKQSEAEAYLQGKSRELEAKGWTVRYSLSTGDPAQEILRQVESSRPDLVALANHGRRGPWRWIRGSVTERVLRNCPTPLLITHEQPEGTQALAFKRILVPLDGSERAGEVLPLAISVARAFAAEILLLRASDAHHFTLAEFLTPPAERGPIPTTSKHLERDLLQAKKRVEEAGVPVRLLTAFGDPADEILRSAEDEQADLIALTTHGRSGWDRWVFGSVAEKVLRAWPRTVLVLRNRPLPPPLAS